VQALGPGVSVGVTRCGTLRGRAEEGRLCLMGFIDLSAVGEDDQKEGMGARKGTVEGEETWRMA